MQLQCYGLDFVKSDRLPKEENFPRAFCLLAASSLQTAENTVVTNSPKGKSPPSHCTSDVGWHGKLALAEKMAWIRNRSVRFGSQVLWHPVHQAVSHPRAPLSALTEKEKEKRETESFKEWKIPWNNVICHNMDGPRDYHTQWNKSERERQTPWYLLLVESKIWYKWIYLWNRNRLTDIENRLVVAKQERCRGGMDWVWDK